MRAIPIIFFAAFATLACAHGPTARAERVWDADAAAEAEAVMHHLHHAWDAMDMVAVEHAIADDGFLTTFEFDESNSAVRLGSKAELVSWLRNQFEEIKAAGASTVAIPQTRMNCKASADVAVCVEECEIIVKRGDGLREVTPHRGTSVLRKYADGWKFVHWHVSDSGPRRIVDGQGHEVTAAAR